MTDPAAPTPGGYPPPAQGQTPYPAPSQYPAPPGTVPPPPAPPGTVAPPPYGAPPPVASPPKKSNALKIVLIVVGVVVVLCFAGIVGAVLLLRKVADEYGYNVGNCLNEMPTSEFQTAYNGELVACDSADAVAKIVQVHEVEDVYDALENADNLCANAPGYVASVGISNLGGNGGRLLCLAEI
jgi:hypothetical protein